MPRSTTLVLVALVLFGTASAQELDLSHPLYQEEMQNWDYNLLMDCSIKYDITVDIYTNYGRHNQSMKRITKRLEKNKEIVDLGDITWSTAK